MKNLIAKKDTWFKEGTEVLLEEHLYDDVYLCRGIRIKQFESENDLVKIGEEYEDGEICLISEFEDKK